MRTRISQADKERLLTSALSHVDSVPYQASLRWVFYRVLQEGLLKGKDSYKQFCALTSKARKNYEYGWTPQTLGDETRKAIERHGSYESPDAWISSVRNASCWLDEWYLQPNYVEIWYEAKAMTDQFKSLTNHITLVPFGGDASIPYKWQIAKRLERAEGKYQKPIYVIYFGDCDSKGKTIPYSALKDIEDWCSASFEFIQGGLTEDQAYGYGIHEDPDRPGSFQWEAVPDNAAREIITNAITPYIDEDKFEQIDEIEQRANEIYEEKTQEIFSQIDFGDLYNEL